VSSPARLSLEHAFANLLNEVRLARRVQLRIFVLGKPRALKPAIQDQLFLIGREAVINALRHSEATKIEVEIQYLRRLLCLLVRDNGCGISPEAVLSGGDSYSGLRGMRVRAENIGARFGIWSGPRLGTEVNVAVSVDIVLAPA
jgi:signal transduction histidine kinase